MHLIQMRISIEFRIILDYMNHSKMDRYKQNGCREETVLLEISHKLSIRPVVHKLVLGTINLLLPTLFSCEGKIDSISESDGSGVETAIMMTDDVKSDDVASIDIFAFDIEDAMHLDSYQHIDNLDTHNISLRSQSGMKHIFICANGQRSIYDWAGINSMESMDKIYAELRKERRDALCATAEGTITAGDGKIYKMELRKIASEIVLNSIRCDFTGKSYEGEILTDVCVYLTNVNAECRLTADGHIVPSGLINSGGLDIDDIESLAEPDMLYRKIDSPIGNRRIYVGTNLVCYPNTSTTEGPGTAFTRLVIEGKIGGETFWWPININREKGTNEPGIHRNSRYIYDITITRKGTKDPDTVIETECADISMKISPWNEKDERIEPFENTTKVVVNCPRYGTKATIPDEDAINDINLLIFENGEVEEIMWKDDLEGHATIEFDTRLVKGRKYTIAALANMHRKVNLSNLEDWKELTYELPDNKGFRKGLPMSAIIHDIYVEDGKSVTLDLMRMAAKINLRIDRSHLSKDVDISIRSVRIGNYPRYVSVNNPSKVQSYHDVFEKGFELTEEQCMPLNRTGYGGRSGEVSVYMLENLQGALPDDIGKAEAKATYIELEADYLSSELISYDSPLIYRFYLGDGPDNLDVERNCLYTITVTPEDDGLSGSGWRVDKSGIGPVVPFFEIMPGDFIEGHVGDTVRVWCECYPRTSPFDPGYEELNFDKGRGIYDYKVDDDRHGVTLYLKNPGTGIVYMTAGPPIDRSGLAIIYVKP